jgi:hypothetical protein
MYIESNRKALRPQNAVRTLAHRLVNTPLGQGR